MATKYLVSLVILVPEAGLTGEDEDTGLVTTDMVDAVEDDVLEHIDAHLPKRMESGGTGAIHDIKITSIDVQEVEN